MSDTGMSIRTGEPMPEQTPLVTDEEVATLNAARDVLVRLGDRAMRESFQALDGFVLGRLAECVEHGSDSIFQVLNTLTSYGLRPLTDEQVHNKKEEA